MSEILIVGFFLGIPLIQILVLKRVKRMEAKLDQVLYRDEVPVGKDDYQ